MSDSSWLEAHPTYQRSTRDFDYGIGDDLIQTRQRERSEIAARIRRAAADEVTLEVRQAYERAARLAEGTAAELVTDWPGLSTKPAFPDVRE